VKIALQRLGDPKAWPMATADLARTRFGSSMRRLRHANLVHLSRKTARKIAAPLARKTDLILCTESPKSELTDSAHRSIAREGHRAVAFTPHSGAATSA
jgi:hypothetical protein